MVCNATLKQYTRNVNWRRSIITVTWHQGLTWAQLYVLTFSLLSAPRTRARRTDRRSVISRCIFLSNSRADNTWNALSRFLQRRKICQVVGSAGWIWPTRCWLRSSCIETVIPVGRCVSLTADSVLFTCCCGEQIAKWARQAVIVYSSTWPPAPRARITSIFTSLRS